MPFEIKQGAIRTMDESRAAALLNLSADEAIIPQPYFPEYPDNPLKRLVEGGWGALTEEEHVWVEQEFFVTFGRPMEGMDGNPDPNHQHAELPPPGFSPADL